MGEILTANEIRICLGVTEYNFRINDTGVQVEDGGLVMNSVYKVQLKKKKKLQVQHLKTHKLSKITPHYFGSIREN